MRRVIPMIITCLGIVGYAMFHAHGVQADDHANYIPYAEPVAVEALAY